MIVYLDSNAYIGAKYVFENNSFATLKNLVETSKVTVLYTSATLEEVKQHIKKDIEEAIIKYNRILRKDMPAITGDSSYNLKTLNPTKAAEDVIEILNRFIENDSVERVSLNPIDVEVLMEDYFNQNPPFESKKPNEFKDAMMINALKNFQRERNMEVCIVSNDTGFIKAFEGEVGFLTFNYLGEFLKHYTSSEEILAKVSKAISDEAIDGNFDEMIIDYINGFDIDRSGYTEWHIGSRVVFDIEYDLLYVEKLESSYVANFIVHVDIDIEITYRDETRSFYDKEEDTYLFEHFVYALERHTDTVAVAIECDINQDEKIIDSISANVLDYPSNKYINLDEDTMYDSEEMSSSEVEKTDIEYCSECGILIGRSCRVPYFDVEEEALCQSCMVSNNKGDICPACGRKVPHDDMISGFCTDCEPALH